MKHELDTYQANKDALKQKRKEAKEKGAAATENDTIDENDKDETNEEKEEEAEDDNDSDNVEQIDAADFDQPVSKKIKSLTNSNASREDTVSEPDTDQN